MCKKELTISEESGRALHAFLDGQGYLMIIIKSEKAQTEICISAAKAFALADFIEANRPALIEARRNGRGN